MYCQSCGVSNPVGAATCRVCGKELIAKAKLLACPSCGTTVPEGQMMCSKCGADLRPPEKTESPAAEPETVTDESSEAYVEESIPFVVQEEAPSPASPVKIRMSLCPICGRPKNRYPDMCDQCKQYEIERAGFDYRDSTHRNEMDMPRIAGALIGLAGLLGIAHALLTMDVVFSSDLPLAVGCMTGLMFMFGFVAIAGGINAWSRQNAVLAALGALFGIFSVGFFIGAFLSFIGFVLVIMSRNEFAVKKLTLDL